MPRQLAGTCQSKSLRAPGILVYPDSDASLRQAQFGKLIYAYFQNIDRSGQGHLA